jgi:O-antigen ligase
VLFALLSFAQLHVTPFRDAPTQLIAVVALVLLLRRPHDLLRRIRTADKALLAIVALAPASALWSSDSAATSHAARVLVATTLVGVYLASRFDARSQLTLVLLAVGVAAVLSVGLLLLSRSDASIADFRGRTWRGAFDTKNVFGRAMSLGAVAGAVSLLSRSPRRGGLAVGGLCALLAFVSWSQMAIAVTLLALLAVGGVAAARRVARPELVAILGGAVALATVGVTGWVLSDVDAALGVVGRNATLTGRTGLWDLVLDAARVHPWQGYGWGAFWLGFRGPSRAIWIALPWQPPHAHNGVLELALNLGAIGVALWLVSIATSLRRAVRLARRGLTAVSAWPLALTTFVILYNLTEVTGPQSNLFWTLYVAMSITLSSRARGRDRSGARVATIRRAQPVAA